MTDGNIATTGYVAFLFAIFCAWWGQHSGRNAWLWFFFGFFLPPIAGLVLLYKTGKDKAKRVVIGA